MCRKAITGTAIAAACLVLLAPLARPQTAAANPLDKVCSLVGSIGEGWWGKACHAVAHPKQALGAAKALAGGKPGQAVKTLLNGAKNNVLSPSGAIGITAIVAWAVGGAHFVLSETAKLVGQTTSPELTAAWFSSVYWRVAGVAVLLTLPFLVAATIQAMLRSDGALIARAAFGYLPLSFLATGVTAPIAMMLLALTDWMGASVAQAAGDQGSHFLVLSGTALGALGVATGSPFVTFLIALLTAAGGLILWLELLIREAAVYVVVLMLPLVFAAMVWPARRVWAIRSVEVLVALILAKFAIVAVLALAAAALGHSGGSLIVKSLAGLVLVMLGAFAPWVLLRLLPLAEVASSVVGHVRHHAQARIAGDAALGRHGVGAVGGGASALIARMNSLAADAHDAAANTSTKPAGDRTEELAATQAHTKRESVGKERSSEPTAPSANSEGGSPVATEGSASRSESPRQAEVPRSTEIKRADQPRATHQDPADSGETREAAETPALTDEDQPNLPAPDPEDGPGPDPEDRAGPDHQAGSGPDPEVGDER